MTVSELPLVLSLKDVAGVANISIATAKRLYYNPESDFPKSVSRIGRLRFRTSDVLAYFGIIDEPTAASKVETQPAS